MTRRVEGLHLDVLANRKGFAMGRGLVNLVAVLAADDGERVALKNLCVSASVVMVAVFGSARVVIEISLRDILMGVDDVCQLDAAVFGLLEMRQDSGGPLATIPVCHIMHADTL